MNLIRLFVISSSICGVHQALAFNAVTRPAQVINTDAGEPGAQVGVGDHFVVPSGSFASYTPGAGDPVINGDLDRYHFTLMGEPLAVNGTAVDYTGNYRIFYDLNNNSLWDVGTDFTYSFGLLGLKVDFSGSDNTFLATGTLTQFLGPDEAFKLASGGKVTTGFTTGIAEFKGTYTQNLTDPTSGTIQGSIGTPLSTPDSASTVGLLGIAMASLGMMRKRLAK